MAVKPAQRFSMKTEASVFKRLGRRDGNIARNDHAVCKYWLQGRCTRNPCRFLHPDKVKADAVGSKNVWKNPKIYKSKNSTLDGKAQPEFVKDKENCDHNQKTEQNVLASRVNAGQSKCNEKTGNDVKGGKCQDLRSWFGDNGLSVIAQLEGHSKDVTGIVFPSGSTNLYCGSKDKSLRVWDCNSGQCVDVINFDEECGVLVEEGPWIFAGLQDKIKAWNRETQNTVVIRATGGMVNAITMFEDILFAGMEDGTVLSWKSISKTNFCEEATSLKGHTGSVLSLIVGAKMLFSGSADHSIRVWDVESLTCTHVLNGHTGDVTSVICWDQYLLSGSLDKKIKVWAATGSGNIEEVYNHNVDEGVLAFQGMHDAEQKPMLLCSCKDNGVCIYDLPSFAVRGRIFSRHDVKAIQVGSEGLFFTGDAAGLVSVWKPNGESVGKPR